MPDVIEQAVSADLCVGCGLCAGMFKKPAAQMEINPGGFARPCKVRTLERGEDRELAAVCPGMRLEHVARDETFHELWGPVVRSEVGHAIDSDTHHRGSSGGALSALAVYLLESGKVDGVLHTAASAEDPFKNVAQISKSREDVLRAAGSRYAPASPLAALDACMAQPGKFAFIGKPCEVAALRALGRQRAEVAEKFSYFLSFMCAGTPAVSGTHAVVRAMGLEPKDVAQFRYRGNGWPGKARAETADGRAAEMDYEQSWGTILNRHLQFRCKICPDGTGEFADVTCADAWDADEKGYPIFTEGKGRSLVLSRNSDGLRLIDDAKTAGYLAAEPMAVERIATIQPYQAERKRMLSARLFGLKCALKETPIYRGFDLARVARRASPRGLLRNCVGAWFRAVKSK